MVSRIMGSLLASLFFILILASSAQANFDFSESELDKVSNSPQWKALLHLRNNQLQIHDSKFILSSNVFSPLNELKKTIHLLKSQPEYRCRFTGRDYFLNQTFPNRWPINKELCPSYVEFKNKAPADDISIIFASENLTQPSSIMGHTMMSLEGINEQGFQVDHAISFFTDIDTKDFTKFLWGSLVSGKKGYFTNQPFSEVQKHYSIYEQRNLWKFYLNFSTEQKILIHRHLWELKQSKIDYLFDRHNCATIIQDILAVAYPEIDNGDLWVSPIDVAKSADRNGLIKHKKLYPSSKWKVRFLEEFTTNTNQNKVLKWLDNPDNSLSMSTIGQDYVTKELARSVNRFQFESEQISIDKWKYRNNNLNFSDNDDEKLIDISRYRSPLEVPDDVQLGFGWRKDAEGHWLTARWLPASHRISDNNRQYFSENELKILEFELSINPAKEKLRLDQLQIYSVKALNPYSRFSGGISGQFSFGFQQIYTDDLTSSLGFDLNGGVGLARKFGRDIGSYFMLSAGTNLQFDEQNLYIEPEIGFFVYEVFDMKTNFSFKRKYQSGERVYNSINVNQSIWRGDNSKSIAFTYDKKFNSTIGNEIFSIELTTFF
ncbi:lipoprotein N-acyltransferase Lnb domain-containing protein [Pelagibaculum spongiae]|uniref:Uncharacterized protein n=1 Tax=Pelagibaculum spongiae TaxID=2080658 RepID=A0A2V1GV97_9GAMM|nr:DUF4105 domain-containing protein [Pelagibaculum spongiae]PVZ68261.1 hypothetical protein DC094_13290 [Pelagibaculum spongiae]